jgi:hypothetical protein
MIALELLVERHDKSVACHPPRAPPQRVVLTDVEHAEDRHHCVADELLEVPPWRIGSRIASK